MSNDCCNQQPASQPQAGQTLLPASANLCDDRLAGLPKARRIRLVGADGRCLREFPAEAQGFTVYDGHGGAVVTNRPVVPIPYRKAYATDNVTGAPILDGNGQPIEVRPPAANSLLVADADGAQNRYQGQRDVRQRIEWDGYAWVMVDEDDADPQVFCNLPEEDSDVEIVGSPFLRSVIENGECVTQECLRLAQRSPSLKSKFEQYKELVDEELERLREELAAKGDIDTGAASFYNNETITVPANSLGNRILIPTSWVTGYNGDNIVTSSGGTFTVNKGGVFTVMFGCTFGTTSTSRLFVIPRINGDFDTNGVTTSAFARTGQSVPQVAFSFSREFSPGDTVDFLGGMDGSLGNARHFSVSFTKVK